MSLLKAHHITQNNFTKCFQFGSRAITVLPIVKVYEIPKCVRPNNRFLSTLSDKMDTTLPEYIDRKTVRVFVHLQHNKEM